MSTEWPARYAPLPGCIGTATPDAGRERRAPAAAGLPRWCNVAVSVLGLSILAPLLALIGLLVRLDSPGPALFRQRRVGLDRRCFTCYKFRTMRQGEWGGGIDVRDFDSFVFNPPDAPADPRLTRLGTALRATSMDELPQLLNIIRGEMALVGPRPELPEIVAQYPEQFHLRHTVPPGLSGLAQVNGRSDLTYSETVSYDAEYVRHRSARLDLRLLWQTGAVVLRGSGAR